MLEEWQGIYHKFSPYPKNDNKFGVACLLTSYQEFLSTLTCLHVMYIQIHSVDGITQVCNITSDSLPRLQSWIHKKF